jgi:hypothetical protein
MNPQPRLRSEPQTVQVADIKQGKLTESFDGVCSTAHRAGHLSLSPDYQHSAFLKTFVHEQKVAFGSANGQGKCLVAASILSWGQGSSAAPNARSPVSASPCKISSKNLETDSVDSDATFVRDSSAVHQDQSTGSSGGQPKMHLKCPEQDSGFYTAREYLNPCSPAISACRVAVNSTAHSDTKSSGHDSIQSPILSATAAARALQTPLVCKGQNCSTAASEENFSISDLTDVPRDVRASHALSAANIVPYSEKHLQSCVRHLPLSSAW